MLTLLHAVVWYFAREQFPENHAEGPDVDFFAARQLLDGFRGHPGDGSGERHFLAHSAPGFRRAKVADFDYFVVAY